jgi:hypothetical protein
MTTISSAVEALFCQQLVNAMSSVGVLTIYDSNGNPIAFVPLANPPAVVFNNEVILLGTPTAVTVSSGALVGAVPFSASIQGSSGVVVSGIPVVTAQTSIVVTSSAVSPGQQLGILTGLVVNP